MAQAIASKIQVTAEDRASAVLRGIASELETVRKRTFSAGAALSSIGTGIGVGAGLTGIGGLADVLGSGFSTNIRVENLDAAFKAIHDDGKEAAETLAYIRYEADRLGQSYLDMAESSKTFFASAKDSAIEEDARDIYTAFSELSTVLRLTEDQTKGVFLALGQMASKGKVMAEELRQQLGERAPGVFRLMADALGVDTGGLDRMLERGEVGIEGLSKMADLIRERFGSALPDAVNSTTAAVGRLNTAWDDLMLHASSGKMLTEGIRQATEAVKLLDAGVQALGEHQREIVSGAVALGAAYLSARGLNSRTVKGTVSLATGSDTRERIRLIREWADTRIAENRRVLEETTRQRDAYLSKVQSKYGQDLGGAGPNLKRSISGRLEGYAEVMAGSSARITRLENGMARAEAAASRMTSVSGRAASGLNLLKKAGSSALSFFGGPWVAGISAVVGGFAWLHAESERDKATVRELAAQFDLLSSSTAKAAEGQKSFAQAYAETLKTRALAEEQRAKLELGNVQELFNNFYNNMARTSVLPDFGAYDTGEGDLFGVMRAFAEGKTGAEETLRSIEGLKQEYGALNPLLLRASELVKALAQQKRNLAEATEEVRLKTAEAAGTQATEAQQTLVAVNQLSQAMSIIDNMKLGVDAEIPGTLAAAIQNMYDYAKSSDTVKIAQKELARANIELSMSFVQESMAKLEAQRGSEAFTESAARQLETLRKVYGILERGVAETDAKPARTGVSGLNAMRNAEERIRRFREEIDVLNGTSAKSAANLKKTLEEIRQTGKAAKMSRDEIASLTEEYRQAFRASTLKEFNRELLSASDMTEELRGLEIADAVSEWTFRLQAAGLSAEDATRKAGELGKALERQTEDRNLEISAGFYEKLAELSGQYGLSIEWQNRLIEEQAKDWETAGIPLAHITEMIRLQQQELSRDPWEGASRGVRKFYADATNYGAGFESATSNLLNNLSNTFELTTDGMRINWENTMYGMYNDFLNIFMRRVVASIADSGMGWLGSLFGSTFNGLTSSAAAGAAATSGYTGMGYRYSGGSALGNVFSGGDLSSYRNSIVSSPTFFTHDRHISRYAKGAGLMGEAGPEAIMPLARMSGGKLGVLAETGTSPQNINITVELENKSGQQLQASQTSTRFDGRKWVVGVVIDAYQNNEMNMRNVLNMR